MYPPASLLQPSRAPDYTGKTWGDLAEHCVELQSQLEQCNGDKRALREWSSPD